MAVFVDEDRPAGAYKVTWDATKFASCVYFYRIKVVSATNPIEQFLDVKKLILLK